MGQRQQKLLLCPKSGGYIGFSRSNRTNPMIKILSIQEHLRPALPEIRGCKDYQEEQELLGQIDRILRESGIEDVWLRQCAEAFDLRAAEQKIAGVEVKAGVRAKSNYMEQSRWALRCVILLRLTGMSFRKMSKQLAMSLLYRWFVRLPELALVRVPSKSRLQRYEQWLPAEKLEKIMEVLLAGVREPQKAVCLGLEQELDMSCVWVDATCVKACVHFPTDWVLLRDAVRTIMKSILTIRRHGLRHRVGTPEVFLSTVNALSMKMAAAGRRGQAGGKKERKETLRCLKRLSRVVEGHGKRYRQLLDEHWQESDLRSRAEVEVILRRLDNVLCKLPEARRQAHERIIGGRKVANEEKILSLYEEDIHVIVRGKAGANVEFGNGLLMVESIEGFIVDHQLEQHRVPDDGRWLRERLAGIKAKCGGGKLTVCADRGFDSATTSKCLKKQEVSNAICPRNPQELARRCTQEPGFTDLLRRRGGTEARIAIVKNVFLDGVPRAKGFKHRQVQVAWAVLTHNLWVVARLASCARRSKEKLLAA